MNVPKSEFTRDFFAVRTIFRFEDVELEGDRRSTMFEERVVLVRAGSYEEAERKGEEEAKRYAASSGKPKQLDYLVVFGIQEESLEECEEVWVSMRESDLPDNDFLSQTYGNELFGLRHHEKRE